LDGAHGDVGAVFYARVCRSVGQQGVPQLEP